MAARSNANDREVTVCCWILDYGCHRVWEEMHDSLAISSEWWMGIIQGIVNEFLEPITLRRYQPLVTICQLCQMLQRGRVALEYSEPTRSPDEIRASVKALKEATALLPCLASEADANVQRELQSLIRRLNVMVWARNR